MNLSNLDLKRICGFRSLRQRASFMHELDPEQVISLENFSIGKCGCPCGHCYLDIKIRPIQISGLAVRQNQ